MSIQFSFTTMAAAYIICIFVYLAYCCSNNVSAGYVRDLYHDGVGIIHGDPVKITEVPFHAILWNKKTGNFICGGSIVHEQFVVTAAHCVIPMKKNQGYYVIKVGTDNLKRGDMYEIEKAFWHPKFNYSTGDCDVGVIKLKTKLKLSSTVQKIAMADSSLLFKKGDVFNTLGFGETEKGEVSEILLKVDVPYIEREECSKIEAPFDITERMICAGNQGKHYKGPSFGDSGGALRFKNHLLGIVSWSSKAYGLPKVFSFVPALRDYVDKIIKDNL